MSVVSSMKEQAKSLTRKALRIGSDFVHPGSADSSEHTPDVYSNQGPMAQVVGIDHEITLPYTTQWGPDRDTTVAFDPATGLLTASTQSIAPIDDDFTIYRLYEQRAERAPQDPLYTFKQDNTWVTLNAQEVLADIRLTAKGLLHLGLAKGDGVAFMCRTRYEWNVIDAAVTGLGGVLATIYDTDSAEQIRNIVNNSDAKLLIVETLDMRDKAEEATASGKCPTLNQTLCLATGALAEIQAYGASVSDTELDAAFDAVHADDLCSIVYTSGSTAAPKGVEMTHRQYCTTALNLPGYMPDLLQQDMGKESVLLFLPQAHSFARAINYIVVASNLRVYIATGIKTLLADLQVAKPTVMIVVPRVLEKVYNAASQKAGHGAKGMVFASAVLTAQQYMQEIGEYGKAKALTKSRRLAFDPLVYASLRQALGGRARWIVAGGAPLDPELLAFFRGAGVPVYEGYGLTETTAPCAFNPLGVPFHSGSVGIPFPGFSLRISEDGEIQVKGPGVFHGYHKNDQATSESFTSDGWYATGDLGTLTRDGFLSITGRKKDLIITAGGKNVAPGPIEEVIQRCEIVSQALVLGDKRPFISALITLDEESLRLWLEAKGLDSTMSLEDAAHNAAVRAEVQDYIDQANEGVSRAESVRKFIILPQEFSQENGLMTASMKIIRPKVIQRYATLLNTQMYTSRKPQE